MSIIARFRIFLDEPTGKLALHLEREYPPEYNEEDIFVLEKYDLDLTDRATRLELRNAIQAQTVLQYMSQHLTMSASFHMVPINQFTDRDQLIRSANLRMNPLLIDLTDFIKAQNSIYLDQVTEPDHLYLYRFVYSYNGYVYNTEYVAGFERVSETVFTSDITGLPIYKTQITAETMERLFGPGWIHLKKYFDTEMREVRTRYKQDPIVFKLPGRRVNFRYRGPLERYKIELMYNEVNRQVNLADWLFNIINTEVARNWQFLYEVDAKSRTLHAVSERQMVLFREAVENAAGEYLFGILFKTADITRILSVDGMGDSHLIPELMDKNGIYVLVTTVEAAAAVYAVLSEDRMGIEEDIFIALPTSSTPIYTLEFRYE